MEVKMPYRNNEARRAAEKERYRLRVDGNLPPSRPADTGNPVSGQPVWMPEVGRMGLRLEDGSVRDVGFGTDERPDTQGKAS
jgi:hypothetical protein